MNLRLYARFVTHTAILTGGAMACWIVFATTGDLADVIIWGIKIFLATLLIGLVLAPPYWLVATTISLFTKKETS